MNIEFNPIPEYQTRMSKINFVPAWQGNSNNTKTLSNRTNHWIENNKMKKMNIRIRNKNKFQTRSNSNLIKVVMLNQFYQQLKTLSILNKKVIIS